MRVVLLTWIQHQGRVDLVSLRVPLSAGNRRPGAVGEDELGSVLDELLCEGIHGQTQDDCDGAESQKVSSQVSDAGERPTDFENLPALAIPQQLQAS